MDKIQKALARLPKEYKALFDALAFKLSARNFADLDLVKMKGHKNIFRVKHGRLRIIFRMDGEKLELLEVGLRSEKTYRRF